MSDLPIHNNKYTSVVWGSSDKKKESSVKRKLFNDEEITMEKNGGNSKTAILKYIYI